MDLEPRPSGDRSDGESGSTGEGVISPDCEPEAGVLRSRGWFVVLPEVGLESLGCEREREEVEDEGCWVVGCSEIGAESVDCEREEVEDEGCRVVVRSEGGSEEDATVLEGSGDRFKPKASPTAAMSKLPATNAPIISGLRPFSWMAGLEPMGAVCRGEGLAMGGVGRFGAGGTPPGATATVAISETASPACPDCKALSISLAVAKRSLALN